MPTATTVIQLVRHAVHDHGDAILCGRMAGVSLSATGRAQLPWLQARIGAVSAVYSSPQPRCRQTAAALGPVTTEPGLDEIDFGAWTGQRFDALALDPAWRHWNADRDAGQAPGGESAIAAQARAVACVHTLAQRHSGGRVALVSHGDVIKSVLFHCIGLKLQAYGRLAITQASVSTLILSDPALVASVNETAGGGTLGTMGS